MKLDRTKNATRNIVFGVLTRIYQILIPFILRTLFIYTLGIEYLGLNGLFTSILSVLNLAELGVGSAMIFSMYKPIAEDDSQKICALMNLYKKYYRLIGVAILIIGLIITPFIPKLITGSIPKDINVYYIYLLNLATTVISYWLFAYKNSIISAHQRLDISSKVSLVISTVQYVAQAIVLFTFKSYYLFLIIALLAQLLSNIVTKIIADRLYPNYVAKGVLPKSERKVINKKVKDLFTARLGGTLANTFDNIVISSFLGLTILALYQNYFYIISSVIGFLYIIYNSITAGVGNSIVLKTKEDNYTDLNVFTLLVAWLSGFCICCFVVLFQPFMKIWLGEKNMLDYKIVLLLSVYFWVYELVMMISVYKDAAGIWHQDRFRPLIAGVANLILNIVLVQFMGLYGVVLSTVLSAMLISLPWIIRNVHRLVFNKKSSVYAIRIVFYSSIIVVSACIVKFVDSFIKGESIILFIIRTFLVVIISNTIFFLLFRKCKYYNGAVDLVGRMLHIEKIMNKLKNKQAN